MTPSDIKNFKFANFKLESRERERESVCGVLCLRERKRVCVRAGEQFLNGPEKGETNFLVI